MMKGFALPKAYVDMLEERFGRVWANVLLLLSSVALALGFLVAIYASLKFLVPPLLATLSFSVNSLVVLGILVFVSTAIVIYIYLSNKRQSKLIESISQKADEAIEKAHSVQEKQQLEQAKDAFIEGLTSATSTFMRGL